MRLDYKVDMPADRKVPDLMLDQQPFKMRQSTDSMPSGGTSARIPSARARQLSARRANPNPYGGDGLKPTAPQVTARPVTNIVSLEITH
jgi:hypothetical protein